MASEQFSLKWNNFQTNLSCGFHSLLEEEVLLDVTLGANGRFIQAHKLVLAVCSSYFKELFKVNPCKHPIVLLKDVEIKELEALLEFMYKGEVNVAQDDLPAFLKTAEMLKISGLADTSDKEKPNEREHKPPTMTVPQKKRRSSVLPATSELPTLKRFHSETIAEPPVEIPRSPVPFKRYCTDVDSVPQSAVKEETSPVIKSEPIPIEIIDDDEDDVEEDELHPGDDIQDTSHINEDLNDDSLMGTSMLLDSSMPGGSTEESQGNFRFIYSSRGNKQLVHDGYVYKKDKERNNQISWVCTKYDTIKCKGRCKTFGGILNVRNKDHNHPKQHDEILFKERYSSLFSNQNSS